MRNLIQAKKHEPGERPPIIDIRSELWPEFLEAVYSEAGERIYHVALVPAAELDPQIGEEVLRWIRSL